MPLNVLVVDDSAVTRMMIVKTLRISGLPLGDVLEASNGAEGLAMLEQNWVDLVLADINMPVMTGEQMVEKIRQNPAWSDLPIIIVSTEGSETRIEKLQQWGTKFVHKPFSPEMIREVVRQTTEVAI